MLNFTVGPVMSDKRVLEVGAEQVPYFRTNEFSNIMLENERLIKKFANAEENARAVFITGSGTASMEAAIINTLTEKDKAIIVNGGSFGQRFVQLCEIHDIPFDEIKLDNGKALTFENLQMFEGGNYTTFIVNVHETSTGVYYDMGLISDFCKRNNLFLIVDAISSFLADDFDMKELGADVMITGSQKALACPPGISVIVLSPSAISRVNNNSPKCLYLDLKSALKDGERGQTPFTPAVGTLLQINTRLKAIENEGGAKKEKEKIAAIAHDFRFRIKELPLDICSDSMSNAVTPLATRNCSAYDIFLTLKDEYGIWICPNGGKLKNQVFRVGHIGCLSVDDNTKLIEALKDLVKRGILK
jgi:aspartate aminotransferase-like enzyme